MSSLCPVCNLVTCCSMPHCISPGCCGRLHRPGLAAKFRPAAKPPPKVTGKGLPKRTVAKGHSGGQLLRPKVPVAGKPSAPPVPPKKAPPLKKAPPPKKAPPALKAPPLLAHSAAPPKPKPNASRAGPAPPPLPSAASLVVAAENVRHVTINFNALHSNGGDVSVRQERVCWVGVVIEKANFTKQKLTPHTLRT